jgi:hypothetical protein
MMDIRPHRRQFTIGRRDWPAPEGWRAVGLSDGYLLHHDPELRVLRDERDAQRLTLGHAFGMSNGTTAGRFVTVEGSTLRPDDGALLGLLYKREADEVVVTSSPAVACLAYDARPTEWRPPRHGLNWHPSPGSPVEGWTRLFADQCLDLRTGRTTTARKTLASTLTEDQASDELLSRLIELMRLMRPRFERVVLPLTAGLDSRTLFAALCASGVEFETFTQVFSARSRQDAETAHQLARRYGVAHHLVHGAEPRSEHCNRLREHQLHAVCDADVSTLFKGSFYRQLRSGDLIVRGGLFELGRLDHLGRLWRIEHTAPENLPNEILARFGESPNGTLLDALRAWQAHRATHSLNLDFDDAFYFDQDVGAWLASIEQGLDSLPPTSIQAMNSLPLLRCLMSTSRRRRRAGWIQRGAIARFDGALDRVTYNAFASMRQRLRGTHAEYVYYWLRSTFLQP